MKSKIINRGINPNRTEAAKQWFAALDEQQKEELAALDYDSPNDDVLAEVTKDWIEENGGDRDFWGLIRTDL